MGMGPLARRLDCWCHHSSQFFRDHLQDLPCGIFRHVNVAPESSKISESPLAQRPFCQEELRQVMMALDPSLSPSDLEIIFSGADLSKVRVVYRWGTVMGGGL